MPNRNSQTIVFAALWACLVAIALSTRPLLPIDETRYITVAWEMHLSGNWLVPSLNGEFYSHKPPLLFWIINLGWSLFGVSEVWARLVAPLFGLGCVVLTGVLARLLWPGREGEQVGWVAPLILLGSTWWTVFTTLSMFDLLVAFCMLIGLIGLVLARRGRFWTGFAWFGVGIGLGVLAKGPVILVYLLPTALLAPLWARNDQWGVLKHGWGRWYAGLFGGLLFGAAIALVWAIPAAISGGKAYSDAIFWGQTAGRMRDSFAHRRPFWWYLPLLPLLVFPWFVWPPFWRAVASLRHGVEPALRFALASSLIGLVVFSAISGKQPHYLLPLYPGFALFLARQVILQQENIRRRDQILPGVLLLILGLAVMAAPAVLLAQPQVADRLNLPPWPLLNVELMGGALVLASLVAMLMRLDQARLRAVPALMILPLALFASVHLFGMPAARPTYDLAAASQFLKGEEVAGHPLAHAGTYHGEYQFLGRLTKPVAEIEYAEIPGWLAAHPNGRVIARYSNLPSDKARPLFAQGHRGRIMVVWDLAAMESDPAAFPIQDRDAKTPSSTRIR